MAKLSFTGSARVGGSTGGSTSVGATQGSVVAEARETTATTAGQLRLNTASALEQAKTGAQPPAQDDTGKGEGAPPATETPKKRCGGACALAAVAGFLGGSILGKRLAGK